MGLIIFVGESTTGYFAEEVANVRGYEYINIPIKGHIKDHTNDIMFAANSAGAYIIYDVDQYNDDAWLIAEEISRVCKAKNAVPIIYLPAFVPESNMAKAMVDNGIKGFITAGTAADLKDQLEKNLTGYFESNERKEIESIRAVQEEERLRMQQFTTIGVAGACHRIGTTTQALQLVKYLTLKGYKACYIELNSNKYIDKDPRNRKNMYISFVEKIKSWFEPDRLNDEIGLVSSFGIDMYYKQDKIPDVLRIGYDYYVYDYGVYTDGDFNKTAFIREDETIFVVGSSPTELDHTQEITENISYSDACLIFSFVAEQEKEDILMLMEKIHTPGIDGGNGSRTYFSEYTPDPFTLSNISMFEKLYPVEDVAQPIIEKPKKKGLFGRTKK